MTPAELRRFARMGAEARIAELQREIEAIHRTFPDLLSAGGTDTVSGRAGKRRRKAMSAAQRKAFGARMRKYWAERRGESPREATQSRSAGRGRRKMSAAARQRIGEAQRKRWAELKAKQLAPGGKDAAEESRAAGGSPKKK